MVSAPYFVFLTLFQSRSENGEQDSDSDALTDDDDEDEDGELGNRVQCSPS